VSGLNLSVVLEDSARNHADREAVVLGDIRLTYAQVDAAARQVAVLLAERGVEPGDKVALSCPNLPYFPIVFYGALKAGATVVPLNVLLKAGEIAYHLQDSEAKAYFCFQGTPELPMAAEGHAGFQQAPGCEHFFVITADPAAPSPIEGTETLGQALAGRAPVFDTVATQAGDTAVILYTSGTTGRPKGAELTHANLVLNALTANQLYGGRPGTERFLIALPLFHSFGQTLQLHAGFAAAATLVLVPRFEAGQVLRLMQEENITYFAGVPTMWWGLLNALTDEVDVDRIAGTLRMAISAGASLPVEIMDRVKEKFGVQILEGYGLSETSPAVTFSDPDRDPRPGSIGVPVWGVDCRLIDANWNEITGPGAVGEIAIRGHNVMKGYYNRPEATAEVLKDGWFRTGDLARRDDDGFYYIVDRVKDLIIRGGFNVYPRELEDVLMTHDAVSLAAVIGVPHHTHGEEIKAYVIRAKGADLTDTELVQWCQERMAKYKYPRVIEFVETLPMTATGKILKRELT
jgi:long-chain acyl-CoA synthetase